MRPGRRIALAPPGCIAPCGPRWHSRGVEIPRRDRLPAPRSLLVIAAVTGLVALACIFTIDQPIARGLGRYQALGFWDAALDLLEWLLLLPLVPWAFAILLALAMLATVAVPRWRRFAPVATYLAANHLLGRIAMVQAKDWTGRLRPSEWLTRGGDTFWRDGGISFPSGHVVLFASVVLPIAVIWPRTRPLLAVVVFVAAARVVANAHFVSDVIGAITLCALVAWVTGWIVRPIGPVRR